MPHIKINQPGETYRGTTVEIDGKKIKRVRSFSYHVSCDSEKPPAVNMEVGSKGMEFEFDTDCISLDISPLNFKSAMQIIRYELSKDNPQCKHFGIENELRAGFIASILSAIEEFEKETDQRILYKPILAEKILKRMIGED